MQTYFNRYLSDYTRDYTFTLAYNVKHAPLSAGLSEEILQYEAETGAFTNAYAQRCFREIAKSKYVWLDDWTFAGRSNGWFVLLCKGDILHVKPRTLERIEKIVNAYYQAYGRELAKHYGN
jgi:hypothetical protein